MAAGPHVLRDYALLADGYRGVLVGPRGDYSWMCLPRWDSDAVFSSLRGSACSYEITPRDRFVWGGYYEEGSLIWRSRWTTDDEGSSSAVKRWRYRPKRTVRSCIDD
jgi:hypothetical protein